MVFPDLVVALVSWIPFLSRQSEVDLLHCRFQSPYCISHPRLSQRDHRILNWMTVPHYQIRFPSWSFVAHDSSLNSFSVAQHYPLGWIAWAITAVAAVVLHNDPRVVAFVAVAPSVAWVYFPWDRQIRSRRAWKISSSRGHYGRYPWPLDLKDKADCTLPKKRKNPIYFAIANYQA